MKAKVIYTIGPYSGATTLEVEPQEEPANIIQRAREALKGRVDKSTLYLAKWRIEAPI